VALVDQVGSSFGGCSSPARYIATRVIGTWGRSSAFNNQAVPVLGRKWTSPYTRNSLV
jgi:hypothetical protein